MQNRTVLKLFGLIAPLFTWLFTMFLPGRKPAVHRTECLNKCRIMQLVQSLTGYVDPQGKTPLTTVLERCYALGAFPALWAVEGVGKDLAEFEIAKGGSPKGLLDAPELGPSWDKAQLMLHAGIGIGFVKHYVERLPGGASDEDVRTMVRTVVKLCRDNSRPGYYGAAIESLGLAARFLKDPAFCKQVHRALQVEATDSIGYFWRGVGRCLYFHPVNFLPGTSRPIRAIDKGLEEAPTPELRQGMLAGTAWALTVVNMATPEVMEWALSRFDDFDCSNPGFRNGVISSVVMRYDTTPDFDGIRRFRDHVPADPKVAERWKSLIAGSIDTAIKVVHPVLSKHKRLDEVFQYQDIEALVKNLQSAKS